MALQSSTSFGHTIPSFGYSDTFYQKEWEGDVFHVPYDPSNVQIIVHILINVDYMGAQTTQ